MDGARLTVILAEDDDGHALLIRRNFDRSHLDADLRRVRNGQELLDLLAPQNNDALSGRPVAVLLDISMPRLDGIEALRRIKSDPRIRTIPVFMLTTTDNPVEIATCYRAGCNAFVTKPVSREGFAAAIERLCGFLGICQIPPRLLGAENASA